MFSQAAEKELQKVADQYSVASRNIPVGVDHAECIKKVCDDNGVYVVDFLKFMYSYYWEMTQGDE